MIKVNDDYTHKKFKMDENGKINMCIIILWKWKVISISHKLQLYSKIIEDNIK